MENTDRGTRSCFVRCSLVQYESHLKQWLFNTAYVLLPFFGFLEGNDTSLFTANASLLACYCAVVEHDPIVI